MRKRSRTDNNQKAIVAALRAAGASVLITSGLGHGAPDLFVSWSNKTVAVEIKDGDNAKLTPDELKFMQEWKGEYHVIRSVEAALALLK